MRSWFDTSNERALDAAPVVAIVVVIAGIVSLAQSWGGPGPVAPPPAAELVVSGYDGGSDGDREWVRLVLVHGLDTPYLAGSVLVLISDVLADDADPRHGVLCESAVWDPGDLLEGVAGACANPAEADLEWDVGASLFVPCPGRGAYDVRVVFVGAVPDAHRVWCDGRP